MLLALFRDLLETVTREDRITSTAELQAGHLFHETMVLTKVVINDDGQKTFRNLAVSSGNRMAALIQTSTCSTIGIARGWCTTRCVAITPPR